MENLLNNKSENMKQELEKIAHLLQRFFQAQDIPIASCVKERTPSDHIEIRTIGYCYDEYHQNYIPWARSSVVIPAYFIMLSVTGNRGNIEKANLLSRAINLMGKEKFISIADDGRPLLRLGVIFLKDIAYNLTGIMMAPRAFNGDKILQTDMSIASKNICMRNPLLEECGNKLPPPSLWGDKSLKRILMYKMGHRRP